MMQLSRNVRLSSHLLTHGVQNVPFGRRSGLRGSSGGNAAVDRRARECEPDTWWRTHGEAHAQARAGEDGRRLVEDLTNSLSGERAMRRAERSQGGIELASGDADVSCRGEQLMQQGSPLLIDTRVVRPQ